MKSFEIDRVAELPTLEDLRSETLEKIGMSAEDMEALGDLDFFVEFSAMLKRGIAGCFKDPRNATRMTTSSIEQVYSSIVDELRREIYLTAEICSNERGSEISHSGAYVKIEALMRFRSKMFDLWLSRYGLFDQNGTRPV